MDPLYRGIYLQGSDIIWINSVYQEGQKASAVHEFTHYIMNMSQAELTRCQGEEIARRVTALYLGEEYNNDWREFYGCETVVQK